MSSFWGQRYRPCGGGEKNDQRLMVLDILSKFAMGGGSMLGVFWRRLAVSRRINVVRGCMVTFFLNMDRCVNIG